MRRKQLVSQREKSKIHHHFTTMKLYTLSKYPAFFIFQHFKICTTSYYWKQLYETCTDRSTHLRNLFVTLKRFLCDVSEYRELYASDEQNLWDLFSRRWRFWWYSFRLSRCADWLSERCIFDAEVSPQDGHTTLLRKVGFYQPVHKVT
jgi:hypothetical protein